MPASPSLPREFAPLRAILPLVLAVAIVTAGSGLLATKTSLDLAIEGVSVGDVRVVITGYPLGFLAGCATVRPIIAMIGHGRTFQIMATLTAVATLLFVFSTNFWFWAVLRLINGFAMASLFTVAESWINLDSGPRNRGSLIAFYMIMSTLGLAAGQSMINLGDPVGNGLFVLAAVTCLAAVTPFAIDGRLRPVRRMPGGTFAAETDDVVSLLRLLRIAPLAVIAALQTGITNMNFGVMGPIYAARTGHEAGTAAALVTVFTLGGFVTQMPIGWLSDRIDRRLILAGSGLSAALACLAVTMFGHISTTLLFLLFFVYGAATLSIYPVAIAYVGSKVESRFMVGISGRLLFVYAVGAVVAPAVSNELMARIDPAALFLFLGAAALIVSLSGLADYVLSGKDGRAS